MYLVAFNDKSTMVNQNIWVARSPDTYHEDSREMGIGCYAETKASNLGMGVMEIENEAATDIVQIVECLKHTSWLN